MFVNWPPDVRIFPPIIWHTILRNIATFRVNEIVNWHSVKAKKMFQLLVKKCRTIVADRSLLSLSVSTRFVLPLDFFPKKMDVCGISLLTHTAANGADTGQLLIKQVTPFDTMVPQQNGRRFAYEIFKSIFLNESDYIFIKIPGPTYISWDNGLAPNRRQLGHSYLN